MDKVVRDGKVAVLVSGGYGAGWYSWNNEFPECLFCPELVEAIETNKSGDEILSIAKGLFPDAYHGGVRDLYIEWVDEGVKFRIDEYDGSESLETIDGTEWVTA